MTISASNGRSANRPTAFPFLFLFRKRENGRCGCAAGAAASSVAFRRKRRPPSKRARPTNRKKATPSRRWLTLFSEIAHKFRYTVLRQNCHMVLQRLANLPLLYHWRFFFPMVYVELFRFTRSIAGGFLFMNSFPGFPVGNPGKNIICFPCRRGCPRPWGRGTSWR